MTSNNLTERTDNVRNYVPEYDVLRVILTLLVIIGHCSGYGISTPYGGCDYSSLVIPELSFFARLASEVSRLIYLFHMPLYMALSGALYRLKNSAGGGTVLIRV